MEVLGAVSSSLALLDVGAVGVRKAVQALKRLKKAPRELQDALEQVEALEAVISAISDANLIHHVPRGLPELLERLKRQLLDLEQLIHFKLVKPAEKLEVGRIAWARHTAEVTRKLNGIQKTVDYVSTILSTATFVQTAQVHRQMERLLPMTTTSVQHRQTAASLIMHRLDGLTALCERIQSSSMTTQQLEGLLEPIRRIDAECLHDRDRIENSHALQIQTNPLGTDLHNFEMPNTVASVQLSDSSVVSVFRSGTCRCRCHTRKTLALLSSLRYWTGVLHVTVANSRCFRMPCTIKACRTRCQKRDTASAAVQYTFPPWIAATMISAWYKCNAVGSVERVIRLVQIVHTRAFYLAESGDLVSLRGSLHKGRGLSP